MIFRLLLIILLPLLAYWLAQRITRVTSLTATQKRWLALSLAGLLVVGVLIAMGRLPVQFILAPLGLAATSLFRLLPALLRFLPMLHMLRGRANASKPRQPGQQSTIRTRFLAMSLDHETAEMQGEVVVGKFAGRLLASMSLGELMELLSECGNDGDSVQLLQAYLARVHPEWEEEAGTSKRAENGASEEMNRAHALEVLGLSEGAERADIIAAHRDLMRKLHPDRGGNDYLAKKVNAAKDFLLE
jgi:hypothetical protein